MAFGDIKPGCRVVDLGAGNGTLGIGASMLGAGFVTLVESDEEMCKIATKNAKDALRDGTYEIQKVEIGKEVPILNEVDLVIRPPLGSSNRGRGCPFFRFDNLFGGGNYA